MLIRECTAADVELLERWDPTGPNRWHAQRFANQVKGVSLFLLAFCDAEPVGYGQLIWEPSAPIRDRFPGCPEINGLGVRRELWGMGIGTGLIRAAEERAKERGLSRAGLAVADDNPRAARLYRHLGYRPALEYDGGYTFVDEAGVERWIAERYTFMLKDLEALRP